MSKSIAVFITTVALALGTSATAFARGGGGGGGAPAARASSSGVANSNGPFSTDRDHGLDRATDRMSQAGLAHEKATSNTTSRKSGNTQKPDLDRDHVKK
jgi:hypothetical protein